MYLKKLMSLNQMYQKNVIFVIIGIFLCKGFKYESYLCNVCHALMQKAMNFNDVAFVSVKGGSDYRIRLI